MKTETIVCIGAVVRRADEILLVRQSAGHALAGQWTIPWGRVEQGESPTAAVLREIKEEAGITAQIEGLLGVQELPHPWTGMIGILFLCSHVDGEAIPDMRETDAARFFGSEQIDEVSDAIEPLSAWLVGRVLVEDFSLVKTNTSGPFNPSPTYL